MQSIHPAEKQRNGRRQSPATSFTEIPTCSCHGPQWSVDCPDCGRRALAWYSRPRRDAPGWSCACGARGALWELRGAA